MGNTLIDGALIVTMDPDRRVIQNGAVVIGGEQILAVGKSDRVKSDFTYTDRMDATDKVVLPGFIDTHVHLSEHICRSLIPDDAEDWMPNWLMPIYANLSAEDEYYASLLACIEMVRSGTTTFCEAGTCIHPAAAAKAMQQVGIRGILGRWTWDLRPEPISLKQSTDAALENNAKLIDYIARLNHNRIRCWPLVLGMDTASDELLIGAKQLADSQGLGLGFMHASNIPSMETVDTMRSLRHFADLGVLDRNVKITHMVYTDDEDLDLLQRYEVKVAHCPTAAMKHCKGISKFGRFPEMKSAGISVSLGADSANGSDHVNMLRIIHLVAQIFKDSHRDYRVFPAETVLEMATLDGAEALLMKDSIGSIEVGKNADLIIFDRHHPEWHPLLNVAGSLVYAVTDRSIDSVFIAGEKVLDQGRMVKIDEQEVYENVDRLSLKLMDRAGVRPVLKWPLS
ncbi:S-adenosylhomocysteine deaminase (EC; Methylthioadenosine deaminase [Olavius sp. associated proteobacterium Delta 1]|nr:S-adenosylhomocysteine deaminase (EC; Methylthioadenosine deaminase [Olavius sp. associated proteobacterium Delta 1]